MLRIGDTAPNFTVESTDGVINFYEWLGRNWCCLCSHPKAFTPVCTTELGLLASMKTEFDKRGVKVSAFPVCYFNLHRWLHSPVTPCRKTCVGAKTFEM